MVKRVRGTGSNGSSYTPWDHRHGAVTRSRFGDRSRASRANAGGRIAWPPWLRPPVSGQGRLSECPSPSVAARDARHARRRVVPRRDAELRRACASAARPPAERRRRDRPVADARRRPSSRGGAARRGCACRAGLVRLGVGRGDRVAAYLPNIPEALVALLRHRQPRRGLVVVRAGVRAPCGHRPLRADRAGRAAHRRRLPLRRPATSTAEPRSRPSAPRCPTLEATVVVPYLDGAPRPWPRPGRGGVGRPARRSPSRSSSRPVPFDHPLYVLYSSGTTGPAQADRARPRRHPARAPEGARRSTTTSGPATASSGSRRPAG